jgi:hypothetical protein
LGETDADTCFDTLSATASTVFSAALIFCWVVVLACFFVTVDAFLVGEAFLFQVVMIFFSVAIGIWKVNYLQHTPTKEKIKKSSYY